MDDRESLITHNTNNFSNINTVDDDIINNKDMTIDESINLGMSNSNIANGNIANGNIANSNIANSNIANSNTVNSENNSDIGILSNSEINDSTALTDVVCDNGYIKNEISQKNTLNHSAECVYDNVTYPIGYTKYPDEYLFNYPNYNNNINHDTDNCNNINYNNDNNNNCQNIHPNNNLAKHIKYVNNEVGIVDRYDENDIYVNKLRINNLAITKKPNMRYIKTPFNRYNKISKHKKKYQPNNKESISLTRETSRYKKNYQETKNRTPTQNQALCNHDSVPVMIDNDTIDYTHSQEYSVSSLNRELKKIGNQNGNNILFKKNSGFKFSHKKSNLGNYRSQLSFSDNDIMIKPSKIINSHLSEIQLRIIGHTQSANMYELREKYIGYPVTILSSFLTSTLMINLGNKNAKSRNAVEYLTLTLSIFSFLFSVSRQYFDFAKKYQSHDLSSKLYTTLLRSVEVRLIKNHIDKEEKRDIFKDIVDQMSIIEQYETPIPYYIDKNIRDNHAKLLTGIDMLSD